MKRVCYILAGITMVFLSFGVSAKFVIKYEAPINSDHKLLYKTLKKNHVRFYGDAISFINELYAIPTDVQILVADCGSINSRYNPSENRIYICYESIQYKVRDYRFPPKNNAVYVQRVFDNSVFTFWHEVGHAVMHHLNLPKSDGKLNQEDLADEFAVLSMMLRQDDKWMNAIVVSALHYKNKDLKPIKQQENDPHSPDLDRYYNMIRLLYGFRPNTFSRLKERLQDRPGKHHGSVDYFKQRYTYWATLLRPPVISRPYFNQKF